MIILSGVAATATALFFLKSPDSVTFESLESKTESNGPVYNQVSLESNTTKDIWKMRQSHHMSCHIKKLRQ